MKKIKSYAEYYKEVVKASPGLYVRYSSKFDGNSKSYNHQTGQPEVGLSVNAATVEFAPASEVWIAHQLIEYRYLTIGRPSAKCWLLTGDEVGRGSDNEPLVANVHPVAIISNKVLDEAARLINDDRTAKIIQGIQGCREGDWYWNPTGKDMSDDEIVRHVHRKLSGVCGVWAEDVRPLLRDERGFGR